MKILAHKTGRFDNACCRRGSTIICRRGFAGKNIRRRGGSSGEPRGQSDSCLAKKKKPSPPNQGNNKNRSEPKPEPGKKRPPPFPLAYSLDKGFFRVATRAGRFFADKSNGDHLLKSAPATGKFSPVGVACRCGRFFPHDNGMPALRARHRLAGMAIFNLDGIPAFIAIKNHPASSTKQKNRYHRKQPGLKQLLHQSSTITKKYFIYFCNRPKKPRLQQEAAATGDLRRYHRAIPCPDLLPCVFFTPPAYISTSSRAVL
jgi:hypothetical protein